MNLAIHIASWLLALLFCSPKTGPAEMLVLWDDLNDERGGSSHEEIPVHGVELPPSLYQS
jgi:hypothetical protein